MTDSNVATPEEGKKYLINGLPAKVTRFAPEANLVSYEFAIGGGGTDTHTDPISHTRIEPLSAILEVDHEGTLDAALAETEKSKARPEPEPADTTRVTEDPVVTSKK